MRRAGRRRSIRSTAAANISAKRVAEITDNKFQIQSFAAGEIVPGLQVLDAVSNGTVEMGNTALYYYWGKNPAFTFGTVAAVRAQHARAYFLAAVRRRHRKCSTTS